MVQETSFRNDRDQKTNHTATVTKGTRGNVSHKVRRQSISQERGTRLSSFVLKRMFTKGDRSLPHTMTSVPGSSVLFRLKRDKGLMRDSIQESSRQMFPDTAFWNLDRDSLSLPKAIYIRPMVAVPMLLISESAFDAILPFYWIIIHAHWRIVLSFCTFPEVQ